MEHPLIFLRRGVFLSQKKYEKRFVPDYFLLTIIFILLGIGIVMVYSSSNVWAEYKYGDQFFFFFMVRCHDRHYVYSLCTLEEVCQDTIICLLSIIVACTYSGYWYCSWWSAKLDWSRGV